MTTRIQAVTRAVGGKPRRARPASDTVAADSSLTPWVDAVPEGKRPVLVEVAPPKTTPFSVAQTILQPIIGPLETTLIVLIVAVFVLMQKEDLRDRFIRVFGSGDLHRTTIALDDAAQRLSRYFVAQLVINSTFGAVIGVALWLFEVPSPAMWGVLAGLLRFVPYIGALLAAVAPVALGAAIAPGWSTAIFIAVMFIAVETLVGYVVEPLVYGHSTGLSPVSVIISAIFWTFLWGPVGLVLSTPLTLCLVVLGRHVKALEFFDVILGDRPALTPVETFYQRILAGNPDEALAQAETMLGERPLLEYYDEVVLAALRLAAVDDAKGTLDEATILSMTATLLALINDLDSVIDAGINPVAASNAGRGIACLAGQGPFDDALATMLMQVLARGGHAARLVPHASASRGAIINLDLAGIDTIAISYLELSRSPARLRFLVRRLRQRAPNARIVVALWAEDEAGLAEVARRNEPGADLYVSTLRTDVELILHKSEALVTNPVGGLSAVS